jgi:ubiquitin-conjugating enzyme E2 D/E
MTMSDQSAAVSEEALLTPTQSIDGFEDDETSSSGYSSGVITPTASEDSSVPDWLGCFAALSIESASPSCGTISDPPAAKLQFYYGGLLALIKQEDKALVEEVAPEDWEARPKRERRIFKELRMIHEDETLPYISIAPIDGSVDNCLACLEGSPDSPYAGGVFWIHMTFPERYPCKPVSIRFITPVYHPNIDGETGIICCDLFEEAWSPVFTAYTVLLSVLSLLHSPDAEDPLIPDIGRCFMQDYLSYCRSAHVYTEEYARGFRPDTSTLFPPSKPRISSNASDHCSVTE